MSDPIFLAGLPTELTWAGEPGAVKVDGDGALTLEAGPRTDLFLDPAGKVRALNAPHLTGEIDGDFQLSARVTVGFGSTYDAGVLILWADDEHWAKLCFELSPQKNPMVVSVITRTCSDDANAFVVQGQSVWLRVSRVDNAYAFHASTDGRWWEFVRYFELGATRPRLGFLAQSPTGPGCSAEFTEVVFAARTLGDMRDGS